MKITLLNIFALLTLLLMPFAGAKSDDKTVEEHAGKLDQWFTLEEAAKIAGKPAGEAKMDYRKIAKYPYTEVVDYNWKGSRTRKTTGTLKMELPVPDSIKVGWLRKESLERVKSLRASTEAEDIPDLGELAFIVKSDQQYIVCKNGMRFSIWVNLSNDPKENHAKALEIAKLLLAKL